MLRLAASLRRVGGGHSPLHLRRFSSQVGLVPKLPALPLWHQRIRGHPFAALTPNLVSMIGCSRVHGAHQLVSKALLPACLHFGRRVFASTSTASGQPPSGFTAWYLRMLSRYPLLTKSVTAANILAFADMTAQYLANMTLKEGEAKQDWDKMRTARMLEIGAFFSAPILHMWFNLMQRTLPGTDVASSIKEVLAGQLIESPVVNSAFFAVNCFLQGCFSVQSLRRTMLGAQTSVCKDLLPSGGMKMQRSRRSSVIFGQLGRVVFFNNCCSFIWTIYLTSMAGKKAEAPKKPC